MTAVVLKPLLNMTATALPTRLLLLQSQQGDLDL